MTGDQISPEYLKAPINKWKRKSQKLSAMYEQIPAHLFISWSASPLVKAGRRQQAKEGGSLLGKASVMMESLNIIDTPQVSQTHVVLQLCRVCEQFETSKPLCCTLDFHFSLHCSFQYLHTCLGFCHIVAQLELKGYATVCIIEPCDTKTVIFTLCVLLFPTGWT